MKARYWSANANMEFCEIDLLLRASRAKRSGAFESLDVNHERRFTVPARPQGQPLLDFIGNHEIAPRDGASLISASIRHAAPQDHP